MSKDKRAEIVEAMAREMCRTLAPCASMVAEIMDDATYLRGHEGDAAALTLAGQLRIQAEAALEVLEAYRAMLSASPNAGRVTAEMLEAAARAILKAEWELAGETPEDAAWIADAVIDGITDDCEDDALAARMAARAAFEAIGLTVEG